MKRDVLVYLRGTQFMVDTPEEEESQPIELVVPGTYTVQNDVELIEYDEVFEGFENYPAKNRVELRDGSLEVHKTGAAEVDMVFVPGKRNVSYYTTPYGTIEMGISTMAVDTQRDDDNINIRAEYALAMNSELVADCVLDMRVEMK
ncbi:MAG: DUF1934 domain-containing protein [Lachnospiraceae bacterium]|nr:DUF1934 domain-containing protein [Lachnospiraceae bacterium]